MWSRGTGLVKGKKTTILKKVKEQEMKDKREERVYFILLAVVFS